MKLKAQKMVAEQVENKFDFFLLFVGKNRVFVFTVLMYGYEDLILSRTNF